MLILIRVPFLVYWGLEAAKIFHLFSLYNSCVLIPLEPSYLSSLFLRFSEKVLSIIFLCLKYVFLNKSCAITGLRVKLSLKSIFPAPLQISKPSFLLSLYYPYKPWAIKDLRAKLSLKSVFIIKTTCLYRSQSQAFSQICIYHKSPLPLQISKSSFLSSS